MNFNTLVETILEGALGTMDSDDFESKVLKSYVDKKGNPTYVVRVGPAGEYNFKRRSSYMYADIEVVELEQETGYKTSHGNYSYKTMVDSNNIGDDSKVAFRWWDCAAKGILKTIEEYKLVNNLDSETKEDWKDILTKL